MDTPKVVVITGPTASGKTALGVRLSKLFGGEVISADSMQIYKYMDIGTAKPSPEETEGVPHHMIDVASPFESYSVGRYVEEASRCVDGVLARGKLPFIVGGTGLYIDSLVSGREFAACGDPKLRAKLMAEAVEKGGREMLERLRGVDPEAATRLHENDIKRIVRALEVYELTGETITVHDEKTKQIPPRYDAVRIALDFKDRQDLYDRVDRRVDEMIDRGLEDEVRRLLGMGLTADHTAMQAIGYKEMAEAVSGKLTVQESIDAIKQNSRRYAKRQLSWLRRDGSINWIVFEKTPDMSKAVLDSTRFLTSRGYNIAVDKK